MKNTYVGNLAGLIINNAKLHAKSKVGYCKTLLG